MPASVDRDAVGIESRVERRRPHRRQPDRHRDVGVRAALIPQAQRRAGAHAQLVGRDRRDRDRRRGEPRGGSGTRPTVAYGRHGSQTEATVPATSRRLSSATRRAVKRDGQTLARAPRRRAASSVSETWGSSSLRQPSSSSSNVSAGSDSIGPSSRTARRRRLVGIATAARSAKIYALGEGGRRCRGCDGEYAAGVRIVERSVLPERRAAGRGQHRGSASRASLVRWRTDACGGRSRHPAPRAPR